jgi:ABC-2 type transport system permease protein
VAEGLPARRSRARGARRRRILPPQVIQARHRDVTAALVYLRLAAAAVRANMGQPLFLAMRTVAAGLIVAVEVTAVVLLLDRFGTIGGWRAPEVVLLFGLAFASQGLALALGNRLEADHLSLLVRKGTFDQVLTRPVSPLGWLVASYVDARYLGRLLAGVGAVAWAADRAGVAWSAGTVALVALAVVSAAAVVFAVLLIAAAFTFVSVQGSEAGSMLIYGGTYLASYPMQIYGSALRLVFVWLVPVALAIYVPALVVLDRQGPPGLPAWLAWLTAPVAAAFLAVGGLAWRGGVRRYVGAGS